MAEEREDQLPVPPPPAPQGRELFRAVLESLAEGVAAFDRDGNITYLNRAARAMDGREAPISRAELMRDWHFFRADGTTPFTDEEFPLTRVLRGERLENLEIVVTTRATGRTRRLLVSGQHLSDAGGAILGAVVTLLDITDRRALEEQYLQAQKMEAVGRLAGGVAHDFNNVLTAVLGYSDNLLAALPDVAPDVLRSGLAEIRRASERAAALTRQLLAFSRKQVVAPRVLDLNAVVTELEPMLGRSLGEDVRLTLRLQPDLGAVRVDPVQLEQVLLNLAVNARDAMPQGGRLTVATHNVELDPAAAATHVAVRPGPYVLVQVTDTGCGMSPDVRRRIFEPFFTTKEVGRGTGLGLSTVYGIVKANGGYIDVESTPGTGTTFKVYFPRAPEPVPRAVPAPPEQPLPTGSETVLVVEDDPTVRHLITGTLRQAGYRVLDVGHPGEALQLALARKEPIDLLLTDVIMPMLGGGRLAEKLLTLHPEMRLLYMSGHSDDELARHGVRPGRDPFLRKPFTPAALARQVRTVLDAKAS